MPRRSSDYAPGFTKSRRSGPLYEHSWMTLQDVVGELNQYPVTVLVWFRGDRCEESKGLGSIIANFSDRIEEIGGRILGVTSQAAQQAHSIRSKWELPFPVCSDVTNVAAKRCNVVITQQDDFPNGMAQPAVVMIRSSGSVLFRWFFLPGHSDSFSPASFAAALDQYQPDATSPEENLSLSPPESDFHQYNAELDALRERAQDLDLEETAWADLFGDDYLPEEDDVDSPGLRRLDVGVAESEELDPVLRLPRPDVGS
eukprot:Rmarinus@m.24458